MKRPASLLAAALLAVPLAVSAAPAAAAATTAKTLMTRLVVKTESGSGYDRSYFKHWVDANGDCQSTRTEVLVAESTVTPTYSTSRRCTVVKGHWYSTYDGKTWTNPSDVDIDHVVALKEAWDSGAKAWSTTNRTRFANDLGYSGALIAVTDNVNSSKETGPGAMAAAPRWRQMCLCDPLGEDEVPVAARHQSGGAHRVVVAPVRQLRRNHGDDPGPRDLIDRSHNLAGGDTNRCGPN